MKSSISRASQSLDTLHRRLLIAGVCALILTVGLARFAYTPMLPIMMANAGLSKLAGAWLAAVNYAGYMVGTLVAASISRYRVKFALYRGGLVVAVLSTAGMGLTDNVVVWALLRFVAGASSAAGLLLASGLVLNWMVSHARRPELGLHFAGLGLGIAISGLAVSVTDWLSWERQWMALGVFSVAFMTVAWLWMPTPQDTAQSSHGKSGEARNGVPTRRWMYLAIAAYFCAGFGFAIGATFIVAIMETVPLLAGHGGWVWVIVGIFATPSTFLWDRIALALGTTRSLVVAYAIQAVGLLLPAVSENAALNLLSAAIFGGSFAGIVSLTLTLVGRHFPGNPAKAMAKITLGYGVAQILAPAMAGYIAKASGSYAGALWVTACVLSAGAGLLCMLSREEHSR